MTEKLALSVDEAMEALGISRNSLYRAIGDGRLRAKKFGKKTLIYRSDLITFMETLPALELDGTSPVKR